VDRPSRSYTGIAPGVGKDKRTAPKRKLLIIDDDRAFVVLAAAILRDAGFMVLEAHDAMQGYMYAQQDPPAIILLDMQMPAGGGMSMLDKVKGIPRLSGIPVIVVTASTDEGLAESVKAKGAVGLLQKPVDRDTLVRLVTTILEPTSHSG
jgi:two-component system, chemotaxis family, chemotaxis protein CheY